MDEELLNKFNEEMEKCAKEIEKVYLIELHSKRVKIKTTLKTSED